MQQRLYSVEIKSSLVGLNVKLVSFCFPLQLSIFSVIGVASSTKMDSGFCSDIEIYAAVIFQHKNQLDQVCCVFGFNRETKINYFYIHLFLKPVIKEDLAVKKQNHLAIVNCSNTC